MEWKVCIVRREELMIIIRELKTNKVNWYDFLIETRYCQFTIRIIAEVFIF